MKIWLNHLFANQHFIIWRSIFPVYTKGIVVRHWLALETVVEVRRYTRSITDNLQLVETHAFTKRNGYCSDLLIDLILRFRVIYVFLTT